MSAALQSIQATEDLDARRHDQPRAAAAATPPGAGVGKPAAAAAAPPPPANQAAAAVNDALTSLATFIPAEALSLFLIVCSIKDMADPQFAWNIMWVFVGIVSPGLFALAFYTKLARDDQPVPGFWDIPWSRILAAAIAFFAWGLCVPGFPVDERFK